MEVDASQYALGAILSQKDEQEKLCYGFVIASYCMLSGSHDLTIL